jgi:hypothetical protein
VGEGFPCRRSPPPAFDRTSTAHAEPLAPQPLAPKRFAKAALLAALIAMGLPWASPVLAGLQTTAPAITQEVVE